MFRLSSYAVYKQIKVFHESSIGLPLADPGRGGMAPDKIYLKMCYETYRAYRGDKALKRDCHSLRNDKNCIDLPTYEWYYGM